MDIVSRTPKAQFYWKSKDGTVKNINDLDLQHAQNILKMILKLQGRTIATQSDFIIKRPIPKDFISIGDMAQQFNETMHGSQDDADKCDACEIDIY